jgi:hypothetical protein
MGFLFEALLDGLWMLCAELVCGTFWAFFSSAFPSRNDANRNWSALAWGAATMAGGVAGLASRSFAPTHVTRGPALAALAWIGFPLAGGLALKAMTRLQQAERRAPGIAFVAGILFALAYLTIRALAP